jgi:hypothetical protein
MARPSLVVGDLITKQLDPLFGFTDQSWLDLLELLFRRDFQGAIVGPAGSGKTTLLKQLEPRLRNQGLETVWAPPLARGRSIDLARLIETVRPNQILLVDDANRIPMWEWWLLRLRLRSSGLIITAPTAGRLPSLITLRVDPKTMSGLIVRFTRESGVELSAADAAHLVQKHHGNVKEIFRECRDMCANY